MNSYFEQKLKCLEERIEFKRKKIELKQRLKGQVKTSSWALTFTKKWIRILIISALLFTSAYFALMFLGTDSEIIGHCTTFIIAYDEGILIAVLGYMAKALFETKWENENSTIDNGGIDDGTNNG